MATILVVEDDQDIRDSVCELLRDEGHIVTSATDGRAALTLLLDDAPNLILLDLMMPIMSGIELVKALRAEPRLAEIPIIIASASDDPSGTTAGLPNLRKPYDLNHLLETIDRLAPPAVERAA